MTKKNIFYIGLVALVSCLCFSCQNESTEEDNSEALGPDSQLTTLLSDVAAAGADAGYVADSTHCFNLKLPVEVTANGQQMLLAQETDYAAVAAVFNQSATDQDHIEYGFPVTVVFLDGTEIAVSSQVQYNTLAAACSDNISSNCININYPVTILGYNSSFLLEQTHVINSDAELYALVEGIGANEYFAIDYPVTVTAGGQNIVVNNNAQLEAEIYSAIAACNSGNNNGNPVSCTNPGILTDSLIVYMPFSNNVNNLKGGTVIAPSDTTFVADRMGNAKCAIAFNGSQQLRILSSSANKLADGNALSISLWFKMQNTEAGDYEVFFEKGTQGTEGFALAADDMNTPLFSAVNNSLWDSSWNQGGTAFWEDTTNWHHLVVTMNSNFEAKLYRDGVLQNNAAFVNAGIGTVALDYFIGAGFTGYLDDLRVYRNKVLTAAEVQTLFELEGDCNICL